MTHPFVSDQNLTDDRQSNAPPRGSNEIATNEREFSATFAKPPPMGGGELAGQAGGQDGDRRFPEDLAPLADELVE
jgi:hypothetical protein